MSSEQNETVARHLIDGYFNTGNETAWDELVHDDVIVHGVRGVLHGSGEAKVFYAGLRVTFPDGEGTIDDIFGEGDRVALRLTESGTMRGNFLGMPPMGKRFTLSGMQILRFVDDKLVEMWGARDTGAMLRQVGITPPATPAGR